ncbi:hydrogenase maturation protease [Enterovibrio nigricans]|uniref:Hydrogenase maturation protease n=1 Tax=Enterovibrio nigricans DSM 22720 TaxID=1121868 RepID=A0A1T4UZ16_9GAMM|nr:hydrogenase maturation protease [Enterovibrio nigricans]PKF50089.1 hydrogenase maturation protease [Enterovibrio nigricans]SKA57886.1 hydrogenase maturation protease [Enterovibrio nigricans DSM 22720]
MTNIHILCFGNTLHSDDGIGVAIAARLHKETLPASVKVIDAGIAGLNALPLFEHCSSVLIVDAAELGLSAGSFRFKTVSELTKQNVSDHLGGVSYLLQAVDAIVTPAPKIEILAVQPAVCESFSPGLSDELTLVLEDVVSAILDYVKRLTLQNGKTERYLL